MHRSMGPAHRCECCGNHHAIANNGCRQAKQAHKGPTPVEQLSSHPGRAARLGVDPPRTLTDCCGASLTWPPTAPDCLGVSHSPPQTLPECLGHTWVGVQRRGGREEGGGTPGGTWYGGGPGARLYVANILRLRPECGPCVAPDWWRRILGTAWDPGTDPGTAQPGTLGHPGRHVGACVPDAVYGRRRRAKMKSVEQQIRRATHNLSRPDYGPKSSEPFHWMNLDSDRGVAGGGTRPVS